MSKNHVWIVEMKFGANWYPLLNEACDSRESARARAKKRQEWRPGAVVRVRKYVAEVA